MPTIKDEEAIEEIKTPELPEQLVKQKDDLIEELRKLGFPVQSLEEALKIKPEAAVDQQTADQILQKQEDVKSLIEDIGKSVSDDEFIDIFNTKSSSSKETKEFVNKAIDRICDLKISEDQLGANLLTNKLIEKMKGKLAKTIIEKEISKKLKELCPHEYVYNFDVLGFMGKQSRNILIWHKGNKSIYTMSIKSVSNPHDLTLLFGKEFDLSYLANFIVDEAHKKGELENHRELRSGIWKLGKEWLAVSGGEMLHISDESVKYLSSPIYKKNLIKCDSNCLDLNKLKESLERKNDKLEQLRDVFNKVRNYVAQWKFVDESMIDYSTVLVFLMFVQSAMTWRPWIYLRGNAGSGKSTLIETILEPILGELLKKLDKTTAYCIAQSVGNTTKALVLDEFEKNERNPAILEECKSMNKGGKTTRGTPDEKAKEYTYYQMPLYSSIYLPMSINSDEAQRSRLIVLELLSDRKTYSLETMSPEEAEDFRIKIIDSLISLWSEIEDKAKEIKGNTQKIIEYRNKKISNRTVENFQYSSAILSMITGKEYTVPKWAEQDQINDGKYIFTRILDSKIQHKGESYSVLSLINNYIEENAGNRQLSRDFSLSLLKQNGITISRSKTDGDLLGIDPIEVKQLIKRCEEFKDICIKSALLQIPGAKETRLRYESNAKRCVGIPISEVDV